MRRSLILTVAIAVVLVAGGCGGDTSVVEPAGPTAARLADLWWLMLVVGTGVWVLVVGVLVAAALRHRRAGDLEASRWTGAPLVVAGGVVLPVVVLVPLLIVVFGVAEDVSSEPSDGDVRIEVVGEQFWWRVSYGDGAAISANEVHVPVGRPVTIEMTSVDVIHSFWVPNVAGKVDLIPGETTHLRFEVDEPGVYRGFCAEFCGIQHARMRLVLVAQTAAHFDDHVDRVAEDAADPEGALAVEGQRVFAEVGCASCHAVRGTDAVGQLGPDLTHFASRRTIGAGILPNTKGHLAGWVVNPQSSKPGNRMPPQPLEPQQLEALLAYLEGLE